MSDEKLEMNAATFDLTLHDEDDVYRAFVYLGLEVVMSYEARAEDFPAGLDDFGGWAMRQFARRLRDVLNPHHRE